MSRSVTGSQSMCCCRRRRRRRSRFRFRSPAISYTRSSADRPLSCGALGKQLVYGLTRCFSCPRTQYFADQGTLERWRLWSGGFEYITTGDCPLFRFRITLSAYRFIKMHPTIVSALAAQLLLTQVGAVAPSFGTSSFSKPAAVCQLFAASYPDLTFFSNETSYVHDNEGEIHAPSTRISRHC